MEIITTSPSQNWRWSAEDGDSSFWAEGVGDPPTWSLVEDELSLELRGDTEVCGDHVRMGTEERDGLDNSVCPGDCADDCTCQTCGDDIRGGIEHCDGSDDALCPGLCTSHCYCDFGQPVPALGGKRGWFVLLFALFLVATSWIASERVRG